MTDTMLIPADPMEPAVTELLMRLRIPAHLLGFRYLTEAILLTLHREDCLRDVMDSLYGHIAGEHGITACSVERASRTALGWVSPDAFRSVLADCLSVDSMPRLTVRSFVGSCVVYLRHSGASEGILHQDIGKVRAGDLR